jgi:hypothetical protein
MLTASVGFLAIPGVIASGTNGSDPTGASQTSKYSQILGSLSIHLSMGGIVIGMFMVSQSRNLQKLEPQLKGVVSEWPHLTYVAM